jgi:hypothetical protein
MREISQEEKAIYTETVKILKGSDKRVFMARVVKSLGWGGQIYAEKELGWNRETLSKGKYELVNGVKIEDNFSARGSKKAEEKLPNLLLDIKSVVDSETQTDPTFKTTRLYSRLTAKEIRIQLIKQKDYTDEELPCEETIRVKLNKLGYSLKPVQKTKPKKKFQKPMRSLRN